MTKVRPYRWLAGLGIVVALGYVGLCGWLHHWQVREHGRLTGLGEANFSARALRLARRGQILDSRGAVLATSVPVKTVCANPSLIFTQQTLVAQTLAPLLGLPPAELLRKLQGEVRTNQNGRVLTNAFVVLKHQVPLDDWDRVTNAMSGLEILPLVKRPSERQKNAVAALKNRSIYALDGYRRVYPGRKLASHILGYTVQGAIETPYGQGYEDHGETGIELRLDSILCGAHGWVGRYEELAARAGMSVVLTIDSALQSIAEEEIAALAQKYAPRSATAIIVRPATGEVLALANWPAFDSNEPGREKNGGINHAIMDLEEPGSTFKIVTIATALDDGAITLNETVDCENGVWLAGGSLHDHHHYGILTFAEVVAKSSNIGTAKAAARLGPGRLFNTITNFGFGALTQIPLPGEMRGVVRPTNHWSKLSLSRVPIGQEVSATPLQMVMAMCAIANGGVLMRPILVQRIQDAQGNVTMRFGPEAVRRVVREPAAKQLVEALKAVASEEGTARAAQLEYYTVAGKTGTAEKFANGTYKSGRYYASFIGFFPADRPELCILVGVDEPDPRVGHMGGAVAGPAFRAIGERAANYLRIPPDASPELAPEQRSRPHPDASPDAARRQAYAGARAADRTRLARQ